MRCQHLLIRVLDWPGDRARGPRRRDREARRANRDDRVPHRCSRFRSPLRHDPRPRVLGRRHRALRVLSGAAIPLGRLYADHYELSILTMMSTKRPAASMTNHNIDRNLPEVFALVSHRNQKVGTVESVLGIQNQ